MRIYIIVYMLFFMGCSIKEYKLFEDENSEHVNSMQDLNISYRAKIIPDDVLIIDIYNMNKKANLFMKGATENQKNNEYIVSQEGEIYLPLLTNVKVTGFTLKELNTFLVEKYKKYLNQPYVKSKIKNKRVYVLGEVGTQGIIPITGHSISIIDVLTQSGGFTDHAIRNNIRVISENNGKFQMRTLDLTKLATLNTHNLMIKPNSIVYVEPKDTKALIVSINDYLPFMKVVSSVLGTFLTIDYLKR